MWDSRDIVSFLNSNANMVSPEYFETMGMRILAGRGLMDSDASPSPGSPANAVVNRAFVERFFPGTSALGKRFGIGGSGTVARGQYVIVGVVSDAKYRSLREPTLPLYFLRAIQSESIVLNVRTRATPQSAFQPVRELLQSLDPSLAFLEIHTMDEEVKASTSQERLTAVLVSLFGALSTVIASAGLYGLLSYMMAQRRREIGIRMALGAKPADIVALTARESLFLAAIGIALGLGGTLMAGLWVRALIYGVSPADPASLLIAAVIVGLMATLATVVPAIRAANCAPGPSLRQA